MDLLVMASGINNQDPVSKAWRLLGDAENTEEAFLPGVWPLVPSHL